VPIAARPIAKPAVAKPGPRPRLSRDAIVACALRLMDREGPEALTFRAVARELDLAVGALSRYFRNLADLQDEVAAKVMAGVRPIEFRTKRDLLAQLAQFGIDLLESTEDHPYLARIHGPASAAVISRISARCIKAMMQAGVDAERATIILSVVMNLAYAWGTRDAIPRSPELQARIAAAAAAELGDLIPQMTKGAANIDPTTRHRQWFLLCIKGLLP
jgi:AcrR family transcriptional regulator